jgi:hypothetical protein
MEQQCPKRLLDQVRACLSLPIGSDLHPDVGGCGQSFLRTAPCTPGNRKSSPARDVRQPQNDECSVRAMISSWSAWPRSQK